MPVSLLDLAHRFLEEKQGPVGFFEIVEYVSKEAELSKEEMERKISRFYTNLMLDGRFVTLGENVWDLRVRQTFDKVHIDMRDVYSDLESVNDDEEEIEEEKEYNEAFEEKGSDSDRSLDVESDETFDTEEKY